MVQLEFLRHMPLLALGTIAVACSEVEPPPLNTAEAVHERQAEVLEETAEDIKGPHKEELLSAAEAHRERAEQLEERPGEIVAVPVIVDNKDKSGVEGTAWKFQEKKEQ